MRKIREKQQLTTLDVVAWVAQDRDELYQQPHHFEEFSTPYGEDSEGYVCVEGAKQTVFIYHKSDDEGNIRDVRFEYQHLVNDEWVNTYNIGINEDFITAILISVTKNLYNEITANAVA